MNIYSLRLSVLSRRTLISISRFLSALLGIMGVFSQPPTAHAATITQTAGTATIFLPGPPFTNSIQAQFASSFKKFDPCLGTLTGVTYMGTIFNGVALTVSPPNGSGSGTVNGGGSFTDGLGGSGGAATMGMFSFPGTNGSYSITASAGGSFGSPGGPITNYIGTSSFTPTAAFSPFGFSVNGTNSVSPSSENGSIGVTLTYTYTPPPIPQIISINSISNNGVANSIGLCFDRVVTLPCFTNPASYTVTTKTGLVGVTSVVLQTNGQCVSLNLAAPIGEFFSVSVSNCVSCATNVARATALGYISDYSSADIAPLGTHNPPSRVYTAYGDTFEATAGGLDIGGNTDAFHFTQQEVIGDFDMTVLVTKLDLADPLSKAGLMARENLAPDSRTLQTYFTPIGGANEVQVGVRSTVGGPTTDANFQIGPRASANPLRWLRLTRTNSTFTAYHGTNGVNWIVSGITTQAFSSTLNIGMAVASHTTNGEVTTAGFTDFGKRGTRPGDGMRPILNASRSGANLALSWMRTPRDFAVQVSTNLTDWSLLLAPILEGETNSNQRTMQIPLNLSSNRLFLRLGQVDRVIPDPPLLLTTGLILSLTCGNLITNSGNTLCTNTVPVINAIAQTNMTAVPGYTVTFTTVNSGYTLDTVLQARKFPAIINLPCDDNSAGNLKSQQSYSTAATVPSTSSTFSLVAAVKPATPTTPTLPIVVKILIQ